MTLNELISVIDKQSIVLILFGVAPLLALGLRLFHGKGGGSKSPWKYLYSVLVYLCAIPGMFSAVLCLYTMLFLQQSLLDKSVTVYFAPMLSMILTLGSISRFVSLDDVPGFERISGLMTLLGITFFILLVLNRFNVWVVFFGNIGMMFVIGLILFLLLRWGAARAFRSNGRK